MKSQSEVPIRVPEVPTGTPQSVIFLPSGVSIPEVPVPVPEVPTGTPRGPKVSVKGRQSGRMEQTISIGSSGPHTGSFDWRSQFLDLGFKPSEVPVRTSELPVRGVQNPTVSFLSSPIYTSFVPNVWGTHTTPKKHPFESNNTSPLSIA